jgi:hypothetical protein
MHEKQQNEETDADAESDEEKEVKLLRHTSRHFCT